MSELRQLLQAASEAPYGPLDTTAILRRGRQLAYRRRVATALPAVLVALAIAIGVNLSSREQAQDLRVADQPGETSLAVDEGGSPDGQGLEAAATQGETSPRGAGRVQTPSGGQATGSAVGGSGGSAGAPTSIAPSAPTVVAPQRGFAGVLVFASNRDGNWEIYASRAGRGVTRVTNDAAYDSTPALSPDGRSIAFVRKSGNNEDIYVVNVDGTNLRRITNEPGRDIEPAWSPDSRMITFASDRTGRSYNTIGYDGEMRTVRALEIYVMNADGSGARRLVSHDEGDARTPAWSPDGTLIAFNANDNERVVSSVNVVPVAGGPSRGLFYRSGFTAEPAWSPDGTQIAFRYVDGGNSHLWVMSSDGGAPRQVTSGSAFHYSPTWLSPTSVAFTRDVDGARYRYDDGASAIECASVRGVNAGDPANSNEVCPMGPAPSEVWAIDLGSGESNALIAELSDAADPSA
jgi:TolB protein